MLQHEDAMPFNDYVRSDLRDAKCSSTYVSVQAARASGQQCNDSFELVFCRKVESALHLTST